MTDNAVMDALRARFCKNSIPSTQEPKKTLSELKHAIEAHCDEEDKRAKVLWSNAIETEAENFYNLTGQFALSFLGNINKSLEIKYDKAMARQHIDPAEALAEYEQLVKLFQRDDLLDILEKCATLDA